MVKPEIQAGHARFIELARDIGDQRALDRIENGLHPFKNEFIDVEEWQPVERS